MVEHRARVTVLWIAVLAALAVAVCLGSTAPAGASGTSSPAIALADPMVLTTSSGYLAFGTQGTVRGRTWNVPVYTSADLSAWYPVGDALPQLPAWAQPGGTWSPTVHLMGSGALMFFTAKDAATGLECIGSAIAGSPAGPYRAAATPAVCQWMLGGDIDPEVVTDTTGATWLLWKNDGNCCGGPVSIWSQRLDASGHLVGAATAILTADAAWQNLVIENPTLIAHAGVDVLLYSAGQWNSSNYGTGVAVCFRLDAPCANQSTTGPALPRVTGTVGNGGASAFVDHAGAVELAFSGWTGRVTTTGVRTLWTAKVAWFGFMPTIVGPATPAIPWVPTTTTVPVTTVPATTVPVTTVPVTTVPVTTVPVTSTTARGVTFVPTTAADTPMPASDPAGSLSRQDSSAGGRLLLVLATFLVIGVLARRATRRRPATH